MAFASLGVGAEAATPWIDLQDARVRLVAASAGLDSDGGATLGLHIRLAPGWKTYWREPGEAGFPPRLDWSAAGNLAEARLAFPAPHRFEAYGFASLGYAGEVVLPIRVRAADPAAPLRARVVADFAVCDEVCVPLRAELALDLPPHRPAASEQAALVDGYLRQVPRGPDDAGLRIAEVALAGGTLRVEAVADARFQAPDLFVESGGRVGFRPPAVTLSDGGRRAVLTLPVAADIAGRRLVLTLVDGERALEQVVTVP